MRKLKQGLSERSLVLFRLVGGAGDLTIMIMITMTRAVNGKCGEGGMRVESEVVWGRDVPNDIPHHGHTQCCGVVDKKKKKKKTPLISTSRGTILEHQHSGIGRELRQQQWVIFGTYYSNVEDEDEPSLSAKDRSVSNRESPVGHDYLIWTVPPIDIAPLRPTATPPPFPDTTHQRGPRISRLPAE